MKTPKVNEEKYKEIKSTERSKFSQLYSTLENSNQKAKEKEEAYLKKIENNLLEEYEFYLKVFKFLSIYRNKTNQNFTAESLMQDRINETLDLLKRK